MNKLALLCLIVALLIPSMVQAQETDSVALDQKVERLNDLCPISYGDEWGVNSFTLVGNYALADIMVPTNLSMFLPMLTEDTENAKRLWLKQLLTYGEEWKSFVDAMVGADRSIVINIHPKDKKKTALIYFAPDDFKKQ